MLNWICITTQVPRHGFATLFAVTSPWVCTAAPPALILCSSTPLTLNIWTLHSEWWIVAGGLWPRFCQTLLAVIVEIWVDMKSLQHRFASFHLSTKQEWTALPVLKSKVCWTADNVHFQSVHETMSLFLRCCTKTCSLNRNTALEALGKGLWCLWCSPVFVWGNSLLDQKHRFAQKNACLCYTRYMSIAFVNIEGWLCRVMQSILTKVLQQGVRKFQRKSVFCPWAMDGWDARQVS